MRGEPATVCRHVLEGAPILVAAREAPGEPPACEWQFRCGSRAHDAHDGRVLDLAEVVRRDPSTAEIVLHPRGTALERSASAARWHTGAGPMLLPRRASRRYPRFEPRFPPRPGEPLDDGALRVMADVAQAGFHVAQVAPDGEAAGHAYTVGLFRSWDHPELAVLGLAPDALRATIARLGERVRQGDRFDHGDVLEGVLDRPLVFRRIVPRHCGAFLDRAVWYHDGVRFPALQAVWADADGRFPWDRWFARELRDVQPVLSEPEPA